MSLIGVILDLLVIVMVSAALVVGWLLHKRLTALRNSQDSFVRAVGELNQAAARAEHGLEALKQATTDTQAELMEQLDEARGLVRRLERAKAGAAPEAADAAARPAAAEPVRRPPPAYPEPARPAAAPDGLYDEPGDLAAALRELRRRRGLQTS